MHFLIRPLQNVGHIAVQVLNMVQIGAFEALWWQLSEDALRQVLLDQVAHQVSVDSVPVAHSEKVQTEVLVDVW